MKIALAFFLVMMAAFMVVLWMVKPPTVDAGTAALLASFVTMFIKMAADAIGYQYNSSSGSDKKDDTNSAVAKSLAEKVPSVPAVPVVVPQGPDAVAASTLTNGETTYYNSIPAADEIAKKNFLGMSKAERAEVISKTPTYQPAGG